MKELLSIVIITCNRKEEVLKTIISCIEHTTRAIEFVIVDNNSNDGTQQFLESFFVKTDRITYQYIYLTCNTGVSYARNVGFRAAHGDILFFIDDDAVVISKTPSLDYVCDYMRSNQDVFSCTGTSIDLRYGGKMNFARDKTDRADDEYVIRSYVGFNHFIKKSFTERKYIYPNNLFYGSEELYVGLSVLRYGGKTVYLSTHAVQHNPSVNTRIDRREGIKNGHINTYVIKKYFLPFPWNIISTVFFELRLIRFCKGNIKEFKMCNCLVKDRYDKQYNNTIPCQDMPRLIKKFGIMRIV